MEGLCLSRVDAGDSCPPVRLDGQSAVLGRGPLLQVADTRISRRHCRIDFEKDGTVRVTAVHDNPTYVKADGDDWRTLNKDEAAGFDTDFELKFLESGLQFACRLEKKLAKEPVGAAAAAVIKRKPGKRKLPDWMLLASGSGNRQSEKNKSPAKKPKVEAAVKKSPRKKTSTEMANMSPSDDLDAEEESLSTRRKPAKRSPGKKRSPVKASKELANLSPSDDSEDENKVSPKKKVQKTTEISSDADEKKPPARKNVRKSPGKASARLANMSPSDDSGTEEESLSTRRKPAKRSPGKKQSPVKASKELANLSPSDDSEEEKKVSPKKKVEQTVDSDEEDVPAQVASPKKRGKAAGKLQKANAGSDDEEPAAGSSSTKDKVKFPVLITPDDLKDSDEEDNKENMKNQRAAPKKKAAAAARRPSCVYGAGCYRRNPAHKKEEAHPGDEDYVDPAEEEATDDEDDRPECEYGTNCYRKNPAHRKQFKHTRRPQPRRAAKNVKKKKKAAKDESEKDTYDLDDSFIDNDSDEFEPVDDSDDDEDWGEDFDDEDE